MSIHSRARAAVAVVVAVLVMSSVLRPGAAAAAETAPVVHFVVDVSGSMSGSPLAEAKQAIKNVVAALPESTALGLRSYADSCDQSAVPPRVPIGLDNDEAMTAAVDSLMANGGTPTTSALGRGIEDVRAFNTTGERRIVLLTDGDTGCGISICDWIKQQELSDLELTLYTVGLAVSSSAAADLKCAAEFTGGQYISADSPTALEEALLNATGGTRDADLDGIPDQWEDQYRDLGFGVVDTTLRDLGASGDHKDVFVRIDAEQGAMLSDKAIRTVVDAFANAPVPNPDGQSGIRLHVVKGATLSPEQSDALRQGPSGESPGDPDWDRISTRLKQTTLGANYFHYVVSTNWDNWGSSGMADNLPGQLMVLRNCGSRFIAPITRWGKPKLRTSCGMNHDSQAANFMHELGHTLGLHHGGGPGLESCDQFGACDMENPYKPNYLSVMSYSFAHSGIPGWGVDFSRWGTDDLYVLDETSLSENDGVRSPNGAVPSKVWTYFYCHDTGEQRKARVNTSSDWNCSRRGLGAGIDQGRISTNVDQPAVHRAGGAMPIPSLAERKILSPYDDWAFLEGVSGFRGGMIGRNTTTYPGGGYYA